MRQTAAQKSPKSKSIGLISRHNVLPIYPAQLSEKEVQNKQAPKKGLVHRYEYETSGLIIARKSSDQMQQASKQIIDTDIQRYCRHDVIGFATMNNVAGFI